LFYTQLQQFSILP